MKIKEKYNRYIMLIISIAVTLSVCIYWGVEKSGMFIDEIYSYGLSNGYYTPFIRSVKDGEMTDKILTKQEMIDYVTVGENDAFKFDSVYYNQTKDVHPPLFYWILHFCSSLNKGSFSKWIGLGLNYIIYALILLMLYKLGMKLFDSRKNAAMMLLLYGLSKMGLSTVLMIRMYALLTLLTVTLSYLIVLLMNKNKWYLYLLITLNIFAGLMTQYYFVFFAFYICAAFVLYNIYKKDFKKCILFSVCALIGVLFMYLAFPECMNHMFAQKLVSGRNAVQNLSSLSLWKGKLFYYGSGIIKDFALLFMFAFVCFILLLLNVKKSIQTVVENDNYTEVLMLIIPAALTIITAAILSPVTAIRYVYNISPVLTVAAGYFVFLLCRVNEQIDIPHRCAFRRIAFICVVIAITAVSVISEPSYIYREHSSYNNKLERYKDSPCIYLDNNYTAPITQDLIQLMNFQDIFVCSNESTETVNEYIDQHAHSESAVVFIDTNEFWSSGYNAEEEIIGFLDKTKYSEYEKLYGYGLSAVYAVR